MSVSTRERPAGGGPGRRRRGWRRGALPLLALFGATVLAASLAGPLPAAGAEQRKTRAGSFNGVQLDFSEIAGMDAYWEDGAWDIGFFGLFRPRVLFGMYTKEHPGFGPYLEIGLTTADPDDLTMVWGGGLSAQVPLHRRRVGLFGTLSLAFNAGGYFRRAEHGFDEPGVVAGIALLWHDYNTITYIQGLAGLLVEARYDFGPLPGASIIVAVQVDMSLLAVFFAWM